MSQSFAVSEELLSYFEDMATRRAINHMVSSSKSSSWVDLTKQEVKSLSKAFDGYEKYSAAWLYSKKVQADFYTLISHLWRESWGNVFCDDTFAERIDFTEFNTIKDTWGNDGWSQTIPIKGAAYPYVWTGVYIKMKDNHHSNLKVTLWLMFGNEDETTHCADVLNKHGLPNGWGLEDEDDPDEPDFRISFTLSKQLDTSLRSDMPKTLVSDVSSYIKKVLNIA